MRPYHVVATRRSSTLTKGLKLLSEVVVDGGQSTLTSIADRLGLPLATAHRLAATLEADGYIDRQHKGCFLPGPMLNNLLQSRLTLEQQIAVRLRTPLKRVAQRYGIFMHFGIFEDGMVTYLVKENGGNADLFTAESMQLEAYCSAIGKVLLANLSDDQLDLYLDAGPFVALTSNTITQPAEIRRELGIVRAERMAFDRYEIREDLFCLAVPIQKSDGTAIGGLSASFLGREPTPKQLKGIRTSLSRIAAGAVRSIT